MKTTIREERILYLIWQGRRHEFDMSSDIDRKFFESIVKAILEGTETEKSDAHKSEK